MKYHLFRMKSLTLIILLSVVFSGINAQHWKFLRHELVGSIGTSNFFGELGGANDIGSSGIKGFKDLDFKLTRPSFNAGYRFYINPKFAIKGTLTYGRLNGDDAQTTERFRQNRNLHFRSPLIELSAQFEYYPLNEYFGHLYRTNGVVGKKVNHFSPYLFVGVGGFCARFGGLFGVVFFLPSVFLPQHHLFSFLFHLFLF